MPATNPSYGVYLAIFSLIGSPSSELFVTISASLLAPTKQEMFTFYKRRFTKLIGPFLFWSLIVVIIDYSQGELNYHQVFGKLIWFPLFPVTGVYWFVYAICGLYLIIPIISPWLENASPKMFLFALLLCLITFVLPYFNLLFEEELYQITGNYYFILNNFGGFIGFLFVGVFLRKYPVHFKRKINAFCIVLLLFLLGSIPVIYGTLFNRNVLLIARENLSITSMLYVTAIFIFFQNFNLSNKIESFFNIIAKYSFGIYLIHIIVIRDFVWKIFMMKRIKNPLVETPVIAVSSLLICLGIIYLIAKLPKSKYIVGV